MEPGAPTKLPAPWIAAPAGEAKRGLSRLQALADGRQWAPMAALANELLAGPDDGWVEVDADRYVGVREAIHRKLIAAGPEALTAYRSLADALADSWLREGRERLDVEPLWRIVDEAYASSAGDDALWALGERYLEQGDYQLARWAWQQVRPETASTGGLVYPDSTHAPADVLARLALVSIRSGDFAQAEREVARLAKEYPEVTGRLGGRDVQYAARLRELLDQARDSTRDAVAEPAWEQAWSVELELPPTPIIESTTVPAAASRVALPVVPVAADGVLYFQDAAGVHAWQLADGKPAGGEKGLLYSVAPARRQASQLGGEFGLSTAVAVDGRRILAITPGGSGDGEDMLDVKAQLVGLDLDRDGAIVFHHEPRASDAKWIGPPLVGQSQAAVIELERAGGRRVSVVGVDFWRREPLWRRKLGSASASWDGVDGGNPEADPAPTMTGAGGLIYVMSHQGYIAAMRADTGAPLWLRTYARHALDVGDGSFRQLQSRAAVCMIQGGLVIVAPLDAGEVFALDAVTGGTAWVQPLPAANANLIAVDEDHVIFSGDRLWALNLKDGELEEPWGAELQGGAGQGAAFGELLLWPVKDRIFLIDRRTGAPAAASISLRESGGANLVVAAGAGGKGQYLVAAGARRVTVYRQLASPPATP